MQLTRKQADKQAGVITTLENNVPDHEPLQTLPTVYSSTNVLTEIAHIEEIVTTDCTYANNEIDDFADIDTTGLSDEDLASTLPTVQNCANVPTEIAHTEEIVTTADSSQCVYANNAQMSDDASAAPNVVSAVATIADNLCKESEDGNIYLLYDVLYILELLRQQSLALIHVSTKFVTYCFRSVPKENGYTTGRIGRTDSQIFCAKRLQKQRHRLRQF